MMNTNEQVHLYLGLDLGKRQDFSALALVEWRRQWRLERNHVTWAMEPVDEELRIAVRGLRRIPLETRYHEVAAEAHRLIVRATEKLQCDCTLIVDATGVGQPVVEMFQGMPPRATLAPVVITGAGSETRTKDEWRVPRQDLVAGLQIMLETGQLLISEQLELAGPLLEEMAEMRADNTGDHHNDLVMALSLAAWRARRFAPATTRPKQNAGFQNNTFGKGIYSAGSSPWDWKKPR